MKIIFGLGNSGKEYEGTRHNIGFAVLDRLQAEISNQIPSINFQFSKKFKADIWKDDDVLLVKPMMFMNQSGEVVKRLAASCKLQATSLYVVHDDLDIRLGEYKIQLGKGPRVHKGLLSAEKAVGKNFWRVRIGIENRSLKISNSKYQKPNRIEGEKYVLQRFKPKEKEIIDGVIRQAIKELIARIF